MKSIILALALIATGAHAAEESENNPCDAVENDIQTLECATYNKTTAEQLLKENFQGLLERVQSQAGNKAQLLSPSPKHSTIWKSVSVLRTTSPNTICDAGRPSRMPPPRPRLVCK